MYASPYIDMISLFQKTAVRIRVWQVSFGGKGLAALSINPDKGRWEQRTLRGMVYTTGRLRSALLTQNARKKPSGRRRGTHHSQPVVSTTDRGGGLDA